MAGRSTRLPPAGSKKRPPQRIPTPMPPSLDQNKSNNQALRDPYDVIQQLRLGGYIHDSIQNTANAAMMENQKRRIVSSSQQQSLKSFHNKNVANDAHRMLNQPNNKSAIRENDRISERNNKSKRLINDIYEKHALNPSVFHNIQTNDNISNSVSDLFPVKYDYNNTCVNNSVNHVSFHNKSDLNYTKKFNSVHEHQSKHNKNDYFESYLQCISPEYSKYNGRVFDSVNNEHNTNVYSPAFMNSCRSNSVLRNNFNVNVPFNNSVSRYHTGVSNSVRVGFGSDGLVSGSNRVDIDSVQAQAMAAAAFFARAAQRMSGSNRRRTETVNKGGFCGALQRAPPPMPPALMRRLANRDANGIGKVKVMLRVSGAPSEGGFFNVEKKKRQVTLSDPQPPTAPLGAAPEDRRVGVAAPKMFAFDSLFNHEDTQADVCSAALSDVVHAVLEGADGCLLALGHPGAGQSHTMLGTTSSSAPGPGGALGGLGAIPCAISWLFRGIAERRQRSGARFSVRVSAIGIGGQTGQAGQPTDLLAAYATESDESPGVYLREDLLGGPTELRAPTAERAALFLDAALACRATTSATGGSSAPEPGLLFTLHVYQYSLAGKGGVAGGRSRLHLIDLGGCSGRGGGLPLSGVGNVLLAVLSGQRHPPHRDHPLTPLLRDCLAPLTCHVTVIAHATHAQSYVDALTAVQVASRVHRMRRRKIRFPLAGVGNVVTVPAAGSGGEEARTGSEPDPSSSDLSADTVIYLGPADEATDGEHPPVYLPSLNSGDNRCAMGKALRGSAAEIRPSRLPKPAAKIELQKGDNAKCEVVIKPSQTVGKTTPKGSPVKRPLTRSGLGEASPPARVAHVPPSASDEQWIDGPRMSRTRVAEARHFLKEVNHIKQRETWIDGPLQAGAAQAGYGFMDNHKKTMIRQWVENQSTQMQTKGKPTSSTNASPVRAPAFREMTQFKTCEADEILEVTMLTETRKTQQVEECVVRTGLHNSKRPADTITEVSESQEASSSLVSEGKPETGADQSAEDEEESSEDGPSEVPPALPLIQPLSSREVSVESLATRPPYVMQLDESGSPVPTQDSCLQVTEEDILRCMAGTTDYDCDTLLSKDHPLRALSQDNITVISSFADNTGIYDTFSECEFDESSRRQFDQLAKLRDLYQSQLAMAEVTPHYRLCDSASIYSEPPYRHTDGAGSVYSEPAYRPSSPLCRGCQRSLSRTNIEGDKSHSICLNYASLRHPDGASDPNLEERIPASGCEKTDETEECPKPATDVNIEVISISPLPPPTLTPIPPPAVMEPYDSGHDSTPRTSKHSGISRRAESGYDSVASSITSGASAAPRVLAKGTKIKYKHPQDKTFCSWLRNPFTCANADTDAEISDF